MDKKIIKAQAEELNRIASNLDKDGCYAEADALTRQMLKLATNRAFDWFPSGTAQRAFYQIYGRVSGLVKPWATDMQGRAESEKNPTRLEKEYKKFMIMAKYIRGFIGVIRDKIDNPAWDGPVPIPKAPDTTGQAIITQFAYLVNKRINDFDINENNIAAFNRDYKAITKEITDALDATQQRFAKHGFGADPADASLETDPTETSPETGTTTPPAGAPGTTAPATTPGAPTAPVTTPGAPTAPAAATPGAGFGPGGADNGKYGTPTYSPLAAQNVTAINSIVNEAIVRYNKGSNKTLERMLQLINGIAAYRKRPELAQDAIVRYYNRPGKGKDGLPDQPGTAPVPPPQAAPTVPPMTPPSAPPAAGGQGYLPGQ